MSEQQKAAQQTLDRLLKNEKPAGATVEIRPIKTAIQRAIQKLLGVYGLKPQFWGTANEDLQAINGFTVPGTKDVFINMDGQEIIQFVAGHEFMHQLKKRYPSLYQQIVDNVITTDESWAAYLETRKNIPNDVKGEEALKEEFYADFAGDQWTNAEFMQKVADKAPSIFKQVFDIFKKILDKMAQTFKATPYIKDVKRAQDALAKVMVEYAAREAQGKVGADGMASVDVQSDGSVNPTGVKFSLRTVDATVARVTKDLKKQGTPIPSKKIERYFEDMMSVKAYVDTNKEILDFVPSETFKALKLNSDPAYAFSIDMTTMCIKRYTMQATIDDIQLKLNRPLVKKEIMGLRAMLRDSGVEVSCGACYVDSRRASIATPLLKALNGYTVTNAKTGVGVKMPPIAVPREMLLTMKGLTEDIPKMYPKEYTRLRKLFAGTQMKIPEARTEYRGEIARLSDAKVQAANRASGLRWQSWSDFEVPHMLDAMEAVGDMFTRGLKGQAYTKQLNFVEVMGPTGMAINMSLIPEGTGLDANGKLIFDKGQSFPFKEAMRLRKLYKNVGTIVIGVSDEHIKAALADPQIDFVIPYHASGLGSTYMPQLGMAEWVDYTDDEGWTSARTGKGLTKNNCTVRYS